MYDDSDYRPPDECDREHDYSRPRSPASSRDPQYRMRHDSSRSPRRTRSPPPQRGSRGGRRTYPTDHPSDDASYQTRDSLDSRGRRPARRQRSGEIDYDDHDYDDGPRRERGGRVGGDERSQRRATSPSPVRSSDEGYSCNIRDGSYHHGPGRPYHTLKLDDVPDWLGPKEIDDMMYDMGATGLVDVRVKSDERAGNRRFYAFAEFKYEADAVDFLERNYPALEVHDRNGLPVRIYIEYSHERRQPASRDDWKCMLCHFDNFSRRATCKQCKAPRSSELPPDIRLDGQSDECPQQTPSQFVVVRGLAPSSSETVLAAGMKKLYIDKEDEPKQPSGMPTKLKSTAPTGKVQGLGARPGSLVRVFVVREKASEISCNYGFAEFATLEDARGAVAKYNAQPQFTISSKPVTLAFIHSGVFIPSLYPVPEHDHKFTFAATHNPSLRLGYWNPSVYTSELLTTDESVCEEKDQKPGQGKQGPDASTSKESKKRKADKDLAAPGSKKGAIAMAPQLQLWSNKHAELHGSKGAEEESDPLGETAPVTGPNALGVLPSTLSAANGAPLAQSVSYADVDQMCCLLCRRKFKNEPSLRRHEQDSDLHKANLQDEQLIAKATTDLRALGKEPTSNYRDRAKERRLVHNQPSRPKRSLPKKTAATTNKDVGPAKELAPKAIVSKGAGLLAKMGWSSGEGLGAAGGGRTDIIETMAYTPGVGLGAEGGKLGDAAKEAARATVNNYSDFVSKAKDKARERYEKMG
ncbi:hypothetical protein F5Y17DRAFT_474454 [Xylariaceae sp. FL0594]|nr:hypothetical protein F5Y17DRAFT_474454 [Xylariaceae sp. FL0594]